MRQFYSSCLFALCLMGLPLSAAQAVEATQAGADKLGNDIAHFFSIDKLPPAITITPETDHYLVKIKIEPEVTPTTQESFDELRVTLFDQGEGQWHITVDQPFHMSSMTAAERFRFSTERLWVDGYYDSQLRFFSTSSMAMTKLETYSYDFGTRESTSLTAEKFVIDFPVVKNPNGGFDVRAIPALYGLSFRGHLLDKAQQTYTDTLVQADSANLALEFLGLRLVEIAEISKFKQTYPTEEEQRAHGVVFKDLIKAADPYFDFVQLTLNATNAVTMNQYFITSGDRLRVSYGLSGLVEDARYVTTDHVENFKINIGNNLDQLSPYIPHFFDDKITVHKLNFAAPFKLFTAQADFTQKNIIPKENFMLPMALVASLFPDSALNIDYDFTAAAQLFKLESQIKVKYYLFNQLGQIGATFSAKNLLGLFDLEATSRLTGLEAIITQLNNGKESQSAQKFIAFLQKAKALGKAEGPDTFSWHIINKANKLTINDEVIKLDDQDFASPLLPPRTP